MSNLRELKDHSRENCYIGDEVEIGDDTVIHPNVSVICPCKIGRGCEIFPGVVIGADGFGYYMEHDIPYREIHFRGVVIGDHVDIGTNTCVDRGLLTDTVICDHVKIDNLCHIGHNVKIEENCLTMEIEEAYDVSIPVEAVGKIKKLSDHGDRGSV